MRHPARDALERSASFRSPRPSNEDGYNSPFSRSSNSLMPHNSGDDSRESGERRRRSTERFGWGNSGTRSETKSARPTLLGRLHQVLARVRGTGGETLSAARSLQPERGQGRQRSVETPMLAEAAVHLPAATERESEAQSRRTTHEDWRPASPPDVGAGVGSSRELTADHGVFQQALQQLRGTEPLARRLSVMEELTELVREYKVEDLQAMWGMVADLASPNLAPTVHARVVAFIGALAAGDNFARLAGLRAEWVALVGRDGGSALELSLRIKILSCATRAGQACAPFEHEIGELLEAWLLEAAAGIAAQRGDGAGEGVAGGPRETEASAALSSTLSDATDLLGYASVVVKVASVELTDALLCRLIEAVGMVCGQALDAGAGAERAQGATSGRGQSASSGGAQEQQLVRRGSAREVLRGCVRVLDVVARYTSPSLGCTQAAVDLLCAAVNDAEVWRESWQVMRNLLQPAGAPGLAASNRLLATLHTPPPAAQEDLARWSEQLRGAVFLVSMAHWGSASVANQRHSRTQVLETLTAAATAAAGCGEETVGTEVLMSVSRLVRTVGRELRLEWAPACRALAAVLSRDAARLHHSPPPAPPVSLLTSPPTGRAAGAWQRGERESAAAGEASGSGAGGGAAAGSGAVLLATVRVDAKTGQAVRGVLDAMATLRRSGDWHGQDADYFLVVKSAMGLRMQGGQDTGMSEESSGQLVEEGLALEALAFDAASIHPAHAGWLGRLPPLMDAFFRRSAQAAVRLGALEVVRQLIEDYRLLFEQEITDTVVLPYLGAPALLSGRDPDPAVARAALDFLLHLARYMQCDRFAAVLAALERAAVGPRLSEGHPDVAQGSASDELQEAAARGLLRLMPATMGRLPTSRFTALWGVLLSLAAPGRMPASIRTEIIALLSRMNCTANYRPSLELPGAPEARCPVAIVRGRRGGEATGEGEEGDKAPGGGGWLDTRGLFELLVSAVKGEEDAGVFEEALAGLLRLVRNRLIIEAEDVPSLIQLLVRRLNSNSQCPLGPTVPRDAAPVFAAGLRIRRLVLGYQLLGTALGGWARERELTPAIKRAALRSLVDGLATRLVSPGRHGAAGDATALDEGAAGEAPWWVHADAGEVWDVVGAHEEVTAVCLDHLSLSSCSVPDEVPLHAGRVMDLLGLLMDAWRRSWGQGGSGKSEERGVGLVIKLLHYMKFTAVQIPLVPGGLAPGVFARALESLLALLDRARWGGLVANLANRALALWYLHADPASRVAFANEERREDAVCAIMLDFFLRNATAGPVDDAGAAAMWDHTEPLFAAPGTLRRSYAVGDSLVSIRTTRVGLVDMCARRPTDMRRWVFFAPPARAQGGAAGGREGATLEALMRLLGTQLQVSDVGDPAPEVCNSGGGRSAPDAKRLHRPEEQGSELADQIPAAAASGGGTIHTGTSGEVEGEAVDPHVIMMQWRRGPLSDGEIHGPKPVELRNSDQLERGIRLLDRTPLCHTHKFGIIYAAHDQKCEAEFLANTGGSARYEWFLRNLGSYVPLADCATDVFTGGLDRGGERDGEMALLWRNSLAQCVYLTGTLMPNETHPSGEQVNKKRFIGNTFVKLIYSDSEHPLALHHLSGQFNLLVVVVEPLPREYFRVRVLKAPEVALTGPVSEAVIVPAEAAVVVVRRILIDADIAAMMAASGEEQYSSNWQERLRQLRLMRQRFSLDSSSQDLRQDSRLSSSVAAASTAAVPDASA